MNETQHLIDISYMCMIAVTSLAIASTIIFKVLSRWFGIYYCNLCKKEMDELNKKFEQAGK